MLEESLQLQLDDPLHVGELQRAEQHDVVDAVEELRRKGLFEGFAVLALRGGDRRGALRDGAVTHLHRFLDHVARPDVRGHDDDRVAEVHPAARTVGEVSLVEDLQHGVEDFGVRLLDLVEQHHGVGLAADRFGELAALAVTDVSRRRSDQTRDIVLLAVFAHVDADQAPVLVEQPLRDLLGQQGLAHARGTHEEEDADRAVFVLESGARAADRAGDPLHSLLLSHDAACEVVVEHLQARHLAARYPFGGNTRDRGDNLLDVFRSDLYGIGLQ